MFRVHQAETSRTFRLAIAGLLAMSLAALAVIAWVMADLLREQIAVQELVRQLPRDAAVSAQTLVGELRWQFRLSILVVLNLIVTGFGVLLLWRAYRSSQQSLRDIQALTGDILGSMDQGVITTDLAGRVTSINRRGIELLATTNESVGRPLQVLSERIPLEEIREKTRTGESATLMRDYPVPDNGVVRMLRASCQPFRNHDEVDIGSVVQVHDVTERVLIEERMRRMERYMGLGSLAAGLHHEIKNPLAALSLHVQLLEEQLEGADASNEVQDMLRVIKTELNRIGGVLESFRDFASLAHLNRSQVDLAELIDRQVRLITPRAEMQNIHVQVEVPPQGIPRVDADRMRLEQVLLNLLVNAMEAMPEGGTLAVRLSASASADGKSILLEVIDTGPGIPDNARDRVFDPYFTTKSEGTGMGLALCDKIIRQHQGSIDFRTSPAGTAFEVTLPLQEVPLQPTSHVRR
jgi:PAS domain S-box-containing protein